MKIKLFSALAMVFGACCAWASATGWDFSQDQPDWNQSKKLTAIGVDDGLELNIVAYDSYIGNYNVDIDPVKYPRIKIVYSATGLPEKTSGELFFTGERTSEFGKAGYFRIPSLIVDGKEHTLILDANKDLPAGARMWFMEKRIKQIRLDLVNQFPGKIVLKKVEFLPDAESEATSWDFTQPQPGWSYKRHLNMKTTPEGLVMDVFKRDSQIGNSRVNIDTKVYSKVKIVYSATGFGGKTCGELYFAGEKNPAFSDGRNFIIPSLICDGKEHTLVLDINKNIPAGAKMWNNEKIIKNLRLDLVNEAPGKIILKKLEFIPHINAEPVSSLDELNVKSGYYLSLNDSTKVDLTVKPGQYYVWLYGASDPTAAVSTLKKVSGFRQESGANALPWQLAGVWDAEANNRLAVKFTGEMTGLLLTADRTVPALKDPGIQFKIKSEVLPSVGSQKYLPFDEKAPYWKSRLVADGQKWYAAGHSLVRRQFELAERPQKAYLQITADDQVDEMYINGKKLRGIWTNDWKYPSVLEITKYLQAGTNTFAVKYTNTGNFGGVMFDITANFANGRSVVIGANGSEKVFFKGNVANWMMPEFDDSNWVNTSTHMGPPYAPYTSYILPYIDYTVPKGSYTVRAAFPADNRREALKLNLTFSGTPDLSDDEIVYARLYTAKRTRDARPVSFVSKQLKDLKVVKRTADSVTVEVSGFVLPEFGGVMDGVFEYGIYGRTTRSKSKIAVKLADNPYPGSDNPISVTVDKSGVSPVVKLNGKPFYPTFLSIFYPKYATGMEGKNSPVKVHEFLAGGSSNEWWVGPDQYDFTAIDERICQIIRDYPDSYVAAWVWCQPPHWYDKLYPDRISRDSKGNVFPYYVSTVTFSDPEYRKDAAKAIKAFVEHCEKYFGNKMFAYNMAGGISLEWQGWGCHSMGQRGVLNDYSVSAQRDFVNFAAERYPELNIQAIPGFEERSVNRGTPFRDPVKDKPAIIYEEYYSESIADCIATCAAEVKKATNGKKLAGAYYGYYFEYGNMAYCVNGAGHNGMYRLLKDDNIDFFLSPNSYGVRAPGEPNADMKVFGSIIAAGKFSILEDDTRTCNTTPADHHQTINAEETHNVLRRNWGMSLARRQPICMLPIHEGRELATPALREDFTKLQAMGQKLFESDRSSGVEIAVVVDEKSLKFLRPDSQLHKVQGITHYRYSQDGRMQVNPHYEQNITGPLIYFQRFATARIGAGVDYIYIDDVPRLADKYKFYIFLADFAASKEFVAAIEALKKRDVTLFVAYGAGFTGRDKAIDTALMSDLLGMQIERIKGGALKVNVTDATGFEPGELTQLSYGPDYPTNPRFAVKDPQAEVWGHYADQSGAALASKKVGNMQLVFSGSTHITPDMLRAVARDAGVFISVDTNDNLFAGYGIYSLYTASQGRKVVRFPGKVTVTDVFTGQVLGRNVDKIELDMKAHSTCVMYTE
ncbi:MAG: hypothetical protein E7047_08450 [Lentisphaerae bacterium]|nr:hypothetical protein [Lentisphaerota bacterium]